MRRNLVLLIGFMFLTIGVVGFIQPVLGFLDFKFTDNLLHIISGLCALTLILNSDRGAVNFSRVFGLIYLVLTFLGAINYLPLAQYLSFNGVNNTFHLFIALILIALGNTQLIAESKKLLKKPDLELKKLLNS